MPGRELWFCQLCACYNTFTVANWKTVPIKLAPCKLERCISHPVKFVEEKDIALVYQICKDVISKA